MFDNRLERNPLGILLYQIDETYRLYGGLCATARSYYGLLVEFVGAVARRENPFDGGRHLLVRFYVSAVAKVYPAVFQKSRLRDRAHRNKHAVYFYLF